MPVVYQKWEVVERPAPGRVLPITWPREEKGTRRCSLLCRQVCAIENRLDGRKTQAVAEHRSSRSPAHAFS